MGWLVCTTWVILWSSVSSPGYWFSRGNFAVDLGQHLKAGTLWKNEGWQILYTGHQFGLAGHAEGEGLARFNYVYPPHVALVASWFSGFSKESVTFAWMALIVLFFAGTLALWRTHGTVPAGFGWVAWAAPGLFWTVLAFQNTTLILLILVSSAFLLDKNRPFTAGLVLSCTFFKPSLLPYAAIWMLVAGSWRCAAGIILGSIGWLGLNAAVCGVEATPAWIDCLVLMARGDQIQNFFGNITWRGFLVTLLGPGFLPHAGWITSLLAVAALPLLRISTRREPASFQIWVAVVWWLLCSPYASHYDILLTLPILWWTGGCLTLPGITWWLLNLQTPGGFFWGWSWTAPLLTAWLWWQWTHLRIDGPDRRIKVSGTCPRPE